jgi:NTE family protein
VPIDFVGGSSMGAVVAAGLAMGWDDAEMETRIRKAFVDTSPLDDIAFPLVAMTQGERSSARLAEHFRRHRDRRPVAAVLLRLVEPDHRRLPPAPPGVLREALRASISLPGVLPPVTDGNSCWSTGR